MTMPENASYRIVNELEAKEAAMNGAEVRYRRSPPYLTCPLCGGDGTGARPFYIDCGGSHEPGWEVIPERTP